MKNNIAKRIRELRKKKGLSQELLAENSGLSLRTIQRIENGETAPRGETLKRLADTLNVSPEEIIDWTVPEDKGFLAGLNLSALGFILFPILGVLIPLIIWISKKDKSKDVDKVGKEVLNFQISWTILVLAASIYFIGGMFFRISQADVISLSLVSDNTAISYGIFGFLYFYNFLLIVINTINIVNHKKIRYIPKFKFLK